MKSRIIAVAAFALMLCGGGRATAQEAFSDRYQQAMELYAHGMFGHAGMMFGQLAAETGDVMAKGYETLCAVRMQEAGSNSAADQYITDYPYSSVIPQIRFYRALNLFDQGSFGPASAEFSRINERQLQNSQVAEYVFKHAYSLFELEEYDRAAEIFAKVDKMPMSDYTAPSRYSIGYIDYTAKRFQQAFTWFEKASKDPRFTDQALTYMVECRHMLKDYSYVIQNGPELLERVTNERKPSLARIISESYLAMDNPAKAKEFYDAIEKGRLSMDSGDYFFAGSVLYSTGDYQGAIDNFTMMKDRTDSIGQIASYELGYSYVKTGNKVSALDAFKLASELTFNPDVQEDAHFNYAKLSFDINRNPSVFNDYIKKYPEKKKGDSIYGYMALASLYGHDYAGAVDAYSNIDMLDANQKSNYMKANFLRANQLVRNGSWKDAIPLFRAASYYSDKRDPFNQLARFWLAESYFRSGQYDNALETYTDLYNISALDGKEEGGLIPYGMAYSYFHKGDYVSAAKWFGKYLTAKSPSEGEDAAARKADCDFFRQDYAKAIAGYEEAIARFPYKDNLYPYLRAGIAYGLTGKTSKKVELLSKALTSSPSADCYAESMYELGRAYVANGDNDAAVKTFTRLSETTSDKDIVARSYIELGMIARNCSKPDIAIVRYKRVIDEMPDTEYAQDALLAIESIYQSEGRGDEYLEYSESIGANKDKSEQEKELMYYNAAEQVFMAENYQKALSSFQSYLERYPQGTKVAEADCCIADCHRFLGNKEQACDWYAKSLQANPRSGVSESATLQLARLSYEIEHFKEAYETYSSLLEMAKIESNVHTARMGMMRSAFKAQDFQGAVRCASQVKDDSKSSSADLREADWVTAKSCLSMGDRDKAFVIFRTLSASPSTSEGAEASYMLIQDAYDKGEYATVQTLVYKFADGAGDQSYWLAKSFIALGDSFADQDNLPQAKATFESILNGYSPSREADDVLDNVRMRLEKLKTL